MLLMSFVVVVVVVFAAASVVHIVDVVCVVHVKSTRSQYCYVVLAGLPYKYRSFR